jgi:iron complex transport system substrate-binding protein
VARTLVGFLALLAACSSRPSAHALSVTDDWGRTVALAAPARRIVSLAPATTELLFALGLGRRVVGRTRYDDWPPAARAVASVGGGMSPSVEAVAARRPDLVLLYASAANRPALRGLTALGIPVLVLKLNLAADLTRAARLVGVLAGAERAADSLDGVFDSALAAVTAANAVRPGPRPRVYVDVWAAPPMTVGRGSYLSQVLAAAGAENVFGDLATSSATVSLEAIAARDPDAVLVVAADTGRAPDVTARPGWRAIRAVREGRILVVDAGLYGRPSPRMPEAAADLAARLARLRPRGARR